MQKQKETTQQKQDEPKQQLQGSHSDSPSLSQGMLLLTLFQLIQESQLEYICHPPGMSLAHINSKLLDISSNTTSTILEFAANMRSSQ